MLSDNCDQPQKGDTIFMWSEMYQRGYDNAAISFAYIPDFKNIQDKKDFERGLKEGFEYKPMVTPQKVIP